MTISEFMEIYPNIEIYASDVQNQLLNDFRDLNIDIDILVDDNMFAYQVKHNKEVIGSCFLFANREQCLLSAFDVAFNIYWD